MMQPALPVDDDYLVETVSRLARVPTNVEMGWDTLMEPDHPRLVHYVQDVVRPELAAVGCHDLIDAPRNNLVAVVGSGRSERSLLIQNYTPVQHYNLMRDPLSGKIDRPDGLDEPAVFGQGVSQAKAHQGVMLAVLRAMRDAGVDLAGRLYWAVNNEGRSSHACSTAIVESIPVRPDFGIVQMGTKLAISVGNRGRVDIDVHVHGAAGHSSSPEAALSAIEGANEVVNRLKALSWEDRHPILGERQAIVYKIRYEPIAPHTLPADAYLTVDRRLLPGDELETARREVEDAIGDLAPYRVTVHNSVHMWPSLVDPNHPGVVCLARAHREVTGADPALVYPRSTFDAGGPAALGVATVMYGASGGHWPVGDDFVLLRDLRTEAGTLARFVTSFLGD